MNDAPYFRLVKDDTDKPLAAVLFDGDEPRNLAGLTVKVLMRDEDGAALLNEVTANVSTQPTVEFTADAAGDWLLMDNHNFSNGDELIVSGAAVAAGLVAAGRYFVRDAKRHRFRLAEYAGGQAIDITSAGTPPQYVTLVGLVKYEWQTADVDALGQYKAWFIVIDGAARATYPNTEEGITVEIVSSAG